MPRHLLRIATLSFALGLLALSSVAAQRTKNVVLITTDGLRWQEVFEGADTNYFGSDSGSSEAKERYWSADQAERRRRLLPFIWGEVAAKGQLFGNRKAGSQVRVMNGHYFSYPGYSEFLTGAPDVRIKSNDKIPNPNTNVFEWLNTKPAYRRKVAAACNWEVISWILNTGRNGIPIYTGFDPMPGSTSMPVPPWVRQAVANTTPLFHDVTMDSFVFGAAKDYIQSKKPRAFYLAFGETDEWAHQGRYGTYLNSANRVDHQIKELWSMMQSMSQYRDSTTFIIATDHGRGSRTKDWQGHGESTPDSGFIWVGIIGPDTPGLGELRNTPQFTQSQIAATVAAVLGEDYHAAFPQTAPPLPVFSAK